MAAQESLYEVPKGTHETTPTGTTPKTTLVNLDADTEISKKFEEIINQGLGSKKGVRNEYEKLNKHWALKLNGNFTQAEMSSQLRIQVTVSQLIKDKDINVQRVLINKDKKVILFLRDQALFNRASKPETWTGTPQNILPVLSSRLRLALSVVTGGVGIAYDNNEISQILRGMGFHIEAVKTMAPRGNTKMIWIYMLLMNVVKAILRPGAIDGFEQKKDTG